MEFAQAASGLGLRAIHGAEMELEDGRHVTLLVEDARGWRNLCRIVTARARARPRPAASRRPPCRSRRSRSTRRGLVCLSGCADQGVHDEPALRRLLAAFGRRPPARRAPAPLPAPRPRAQPPPRRARRAARGADGGDRQRPRARALARAAAGRVRRPAPPPDAGRLGARAPRQHRPRARLPGGDGGALRGPPGARSPRRAALAERLRFDLTQDLGYRYPGAEDPQAGAHAGGAVPRPLRGALSARQPAPVPRRIARLEEELRVIDALGLRRLLPPAPRPARARARGRRRGARAGLGARAAAAGARPRLVGVLDRLLPHRPLAHRPDRERAVPRALPQRGADRAAGHRPRLPARRARGR